MKYLILTTLFLACIASADNYMPPLEEMRKHARENLKKFDEQWVGACVAAGIVYISDHKSSVPGDSPEPSLRSEMMCSHIAEESKEKMDPKNSKKFNGCLDGIGMAMQLWDKSASDQKRKETMMKYCFEKF